MASSGIPGVDMKAVQYVQRALLPDLSSAEAAAVFSRMIEESLSSWFTQVSDIFQKIFLSGHNCSPFFAVELLHPQPRPDEVL